MVSLENVQSRVIIPKDREPGEIRVTPCYRLNHVLPKFMCWSLNPQNLTKWPYQKQDLVIILVKRRLLGWALNQWLASLCKRNLGHWHAPRENSMWTWRQKSEWCSYQLRYSIDCQHTTTNEKRCNQYILTALRRSQALPASWSWMSSLQNCETVNFCCLNHPACESLLWQLWETNTSSGALRVPDSGTLILGNQRGSGSHNPSQWGRTPATVFSVHTMFWWMARMNYSLKNKCKSYKILYAQIFIQWTLIGATICPATINIQDK